MRLVNDPNRIFYKCKGVGYSMSIRAREIIFGNMMKVTEYNGSHTCDRLVNNVEVNMKWIVREFEDFIRSCPKVDVETLANLLQRDYKVTIKRRKLYKVMARVRRMVKMEYTGCFEYLRKYCVMVQRANHGSTALVRTIREDPNFLRIFVCFNCNLFSFFT